MVKFAVCTSKSIWCSCTQFSTQFKKSTAHKRNNSIVILLRKRNYFLATWQKIKLALMSPRGRERAREWEGASCSQLGHCPWPKLGHFRLCALALYWLPAWVELTVWGSVQDTPPFLYFFWVYSWFRGKLEADWDWACSWYVFATLPLQ